MVALVRRAGSGFRASRPIALGLEFEAVFVPFIFLFLIIATILLIPLLIATCVVFALLVSTQSVKK